MLESSCHVENAGATAAVVANLVRPVTPVRPETPAEVVRDRYTADQTLLALPVVDHHGCVLGILNRFRFLERLSARFGRELAARKSVAELMEPALVIDDQTPLDEVGSRLAADPGRFVLDGFVVTAGGRYRGVATAFDLFRAATERRHAELAFRAHHDSLTGLPNRAAFEARLAAALATVSAGASTALLCIDLDHFKEINDSLGHRLGDQVLSTVARRLRSAVRRDDFVGRLSGDEFAVIVEGLSDVSEAVRVAQAIVAACGAPTVIDGHDVTLSCSVGIAGYPDHASTPEMLIRAADAALYGAKEVRNHWLMYEPDAIDGPAPVRASTLRRAIERGELEVHYQPIVALATGHIVAAEALVRWTHPEAGPVSASQIVKLAEDSGLIVPLGTFVAEVALKQLHAWDQRPYTRGLRMALNVSAQQVREGGLVPWLDRVVAHVGVAPSRVDLEFTETGALRGAPAIDRVFHELDYRGFVLSIDDFGIGYSALARLERLPVSVIKIDRSFVQGVGTPRRGGKIAQAIVALGRSLSMTVIAEGVETEAQRAVLAATGCHCAQGYLLGRPQPAEQFERLLGADASFRQEAV